MRHAARLALRHLAASPGQTGLLVAGVAAGVVVFVFMAALVGGLADYLLDQAVGNAPHLTLEPPERVPPVLYGDSEGGTVLAAVQRGNERREQVRAWQEAADAAARMPGVRAVSPQVAGSGFVVRGQATKPVSVTGVEPDRVSAIARIGAGLVAGSARLDLDSILVGRTLAADLGVGVGQVVTLRSDRGASRALVVRGVFRLGSDAQDEGSAWIHIRAARGLFDLPQGVTRIEVKLDDPGQATATAARLAAATGLKATGWAARNEDFQGVLDSQAQTGLLVQGFSLLTVVTGVASAMLLSAYRRRPEVGIMRAMGAGRGFVTAVFLLQGALVGLGGGLLGAGLGWALVSLLAAVAGPAAGGSLPVDPAQGGYLAAVALTTLGSLLAAALPARAASRVDPASVIGP